MKTTIELASRVTVVIEDEGRYAEKGQIGFALGGGFVGGASELRPQEAVTIAKHLLLAAGTSPQVIASIDYVSQALERNARLKAKGLESL